MFQMKGVVPPMITPFTENGEVDVESLRALVRFLKDRVNGLFITGSYGCGALMTAQERKQVAQIVVEEAAGKVPVIVQVGTTNSRASADLARHAVSIGADAVSAVGPYYFKYEPDSVCAFYREIVDAVEGKIPVYVYNNPQFQGYPMDLKLIRRLKEEVGIGGIKDATFDIMMHANYMRLFKSDTFDVALGTEAMWLSACVLGCRAFIPGIGNAFPEICGKMYREGIAGDYEKCRQTQFEVNEMREIMYLARSTQLAIYAMLEIRGIIRAYPRSPFIPATQQEKNAIKKRLEALKLL